jgi:hypothetical protein
MTHKTFLNNRYAGGVVNWEAIGAISEMIGALAVVVSLVYLAFQIRQNTNQLEHNERASIAASASVSATNYRENRKQIYASSELAEIYMKGARDPESLDEVDRLRFRLLMSNFVDANWDMYVQSVATGFSPEVWSAHGSKVLSRVLGTPGGRWFWRNFREEYSPEFCLEVDRVLASSGGRRE